MTQDNPDTQSHVLIVGAGSVGILLARRLKLLNISYTVYEREEYLHARLCDWNFGIYWAQSPVAECIPKPIQDALPTAQVNPSQKPSGKESFSLVNAQTGELLMRALAPNVLRLNRRRFREVLVEGIDVKYGKSLGSIETLTSYDKVTATFEDGTKATDNLLIGADGANSRVRSFLLGPEKAALQSLPLMGLIALSTLPAPVAEELRSYMNGDMVVSYHPDGFVAFISDRGQGLNNAVHDAAYLGRALASFQTCRKVDVKSLADAISSYEKELVDRGRAAVLDSEQNSLMSVDWEQLGESPIFKVGFAVAKAKAEGEGGKAELGTAVTGKD